MNEKIYYNAADIAAMLGISMTEQLRAQEQMLWVRKMNNIRARAEEIVREGIIFRL